MCLRQWYMPAYVTVLRTNWSNVGKYQAGGGGAPGADGKCIQVEAQPHPDVNGIIGFKAEKKAELPTMFGVAAADGFAGERRHLLDGGRGYKKGGAGSRVYLTLIGGSERVRIGRTITNMPDIHQSAPWQHSKTQP